MKSKITMVIPTMNRPELIDFALRYHANFPGRIIIADGSDVPHKPTSMPKNAVYLYEPLFWQRRNRVAVEMVDTPYIVFRADRRCITNLAIEKGIRFLEENPAYSAVDGTQIQIFPQDEDGYKLEMAYPFDCLGEATYSEDPAERLYQIFYPTYRHLSIWAVSRTEVWRDTVEGYEDLMPSANIYELFQIMVMAMHGKFAVLPLAFSAIFANYDHRSHYYNPIYPQHVWDSMLGEQEEVFCTSLTKTMMKITGRDENYCRTAITNSLEAFFRYTLKRPRIKTNLQKHLQHLDKPSLAEFHELGRAYVSEIMGRKNLRLLCVPTWKRSSAKIFDTLAARWRNAETHYLVAQDYSYGVNWHCPVKDSSYSSVHMLSQRYDGSTESRELVLQELINLLQQIQPDLVCILSDVIPIYKLVETACRQLGIKICTIQSGFPSPLHLPGDMFLGWDTQWSTRFQLDENCICRAAGSFDYEQIVRQDVLAKLPSETAAAEELVIAIFLPDDQAQKRIFLEALGEKAKAFPRYCKFVIPCPPKGQEMPADLIFARNNIAYLPQLVDEDFLFQRIDVLIAPPSYSAMRARLAGIRTLLLEDNSTNSSFFPYDLFQHVRLDDVGQLFDKLATEIYQGGGRRHNLESEELSLLTEVYFQEGAVQKDFFHEWRDFLYEQDILSNEV